MPRSEHSVHIARPIDEVFAYLNDPDVAPEWSSAVRSAEVDGPLEPGTPIHVQAKFLGVSIDSTYEITHFDPPHRYGYRGESPFRLEMDFTLEGDDETDVTLVVDVDPGKVFGLAGPLFKRQMNKQMEGDLQRLKDNLES